MRGEVGIEGKPIQGYILVLVNTVGNWAGSPQDPQKSYADCTLGLLT